MYFPPPLVLRITLVCGAKVNVQHSMQASAAVLAVQASHVGKESAGDGFGWKELDTALTVALYGQ